MLAYKAENTTFRGRGRNPSISQARDSRREEARDICIILNETILPIPPRKLLYDCCKEVYLST